MVSAKADTDNKVSVLLDGAVDYVTKPFDLKELLARIVVALRRSNALADAILSCPSPYSVLQMVPPSATYSSS